MGLWLGCQQHKVHLTLLEATGIQGQEEPGSVLGVREAVRQALSI